MSDIYMTENISGELNSNIWRLKFLATPVF